MVGGLVITGKDDLAERLGFLQNAIGSVPGPFDCWLAMRGVKTLALRMDRHQTNAMAVARHLSGHAKVRKVLYPGLPEHPGHEICKGQASGFGGIVSFVLDDLDEAKRVAARTHLFALAESLGGVESLLCHPATMTHASIPREDRLRRGLSDGLLRLSVGIEDLEDLVEDIDRALD
jgi:cystathionine beta-lyase/cystathionine gamma-synthase